MKTFVGMLALCLAVLAGVVLPQDKSAQEKPTIDPQNPLTSWNKLAYTRVKGILARSAEKMPEEDYSFKPVDTVRSYGQIVGHVADAKYLFCSIAFYGRKTPLPISNTPKRRKRG